MGGPEIQWKPGRTDFVDDSRCPPRGRLPDGSQGADHLRSIFYRMGFNDQEIVALSGAHNLGVRLCFVWTVSSTGADIALQRCHSDRSGFEGPWVNNPTRYSVCAPRCYRWLTFYEQVQQPIVGITGSRRSISADLCSLPASGFCSRRSGSRRSGKVLTSLPSKPFLGSFSPSWNADGPTTFSEDDDLMMLPTDMCLIEDPVSILLRGSS
jgi:hypothetical protein